MPTPWSADVPLRWSDMDALRHINNVQMVRLLEEARIQALREWFTGPQERPALLVARQEIDYLAQLHYRPEPIVISVWTSALGGASFDLCYQIRSSREPDAEVYAAAETTLVCFDLQTQRPTRIGAAARAVLEAHAGDPVELKRRPAGHQ